MIDFNEIKNDFSRHTTHFELYNMDPTALTSI